MHAVWRHLRIPIVIIKSVTFALNFVPDRAAGALTWTWRQPFRPAEDGGGNGILLLPAHTHTPGPRPRQKRDEANDSGAVF